MKNIEIVSEEEVEEIAYNIAYLLNHGWRRVSAYSYEPCSALVEQGYNLDDFGKNVWVFPERRQEKTLRDKHYEPTTKTVPFFTLADAVSAQEDFENSVAD